MQKDFEKQKLNQLKFDVDLEEKNKNDLKRQKEFANHIFQSFYHNAKARDRNKPQKKNDEELETDIEIDFDYSDLDSQEEEEEDQQFIIEKQNDAALLKVINLALCIYSFLFLRAFNFSIK